MSEKNEMFFAACDDGPLVNLHGGFLLGFLIVAFFAEWLCSAGLGEF